MAASWHPDEPVLRADDHALVGDGAFEAIKVLDGHPFALTRHLARLQRSLEPLGIELDLDAGARRGRGADGDDQARVSPSWLRITVTGGSAPMGTGSVGHAADGRRRRRADGAVAADDRRRRSRRGDATSSAPTTGSRRSRTPTT